jgi:hypothetical protein
MGRVQFKRRASGQIVTAEFPLPAFPELVVATDEATGVELAHQAPADFLAEFDQVLPELPPADASTLPVIDRRETVDLRNPPAELVTEELFRNFATYVSRELGKLADGLERIEATLARALAASSPPPPPVIASSEEPTKPD